VKCAGLPGKLASIDEVAARGEAKEERGEQVILNFGVRPYITEFSAEGAWIRQWTR